MEDKRLAVGLEYFQKKSWTPFPFQVQTWRDFLDGKSGLLNAPTGSGKTFSLAAHYLTLLFSGENKYREILAVTFTNKATEEMKTRILEVLKGFAIGDGSTKSDAYRQLVLAAHPKLNADTLKLKADKIYRKILHDYSRFSVSTIDGFVQKVIRGFAFELGLDSGYSLEMNTEKVKKELLKELYMFKLVLIIQS